MIRMRKKNWLHISLWLVVSVMLLLCINPIEGNAASNRCTIKSCVASSKTKMVVKAKVSNKTKAMGKKLYLLELEPYEKVPTNLKRKPIAEVKAKNGTVTFKTALTDASQHTRLYSKFVVAYKHGKKYRVISSAMYITNPQKLATFTANYPKTYSKKGLQVENMQDSMDLGTQHTVLNWVLNTLVAANGTGEEYRFQGKSYYFNTGVLNYYDDVIHQYNEAGSKVTVILLLPNMNDSNVNSLRFKGSSAFYSSIRTSSKSSCRQFEAIMSYLGQRYGQKSHLVSGWILGNEIGNTKEWNYAGGKGLSSYMDSYTRAFRICDTAVKSVNKNAHVYLSLDYFWERDLDGKGKVYYSDKAILNTFYQKLKEQGLVDWYIAYHAYSQGLLSPEFWDDSLASNSSDAEIVNFNNMNVLTKYVKSNFGKKVKIMFSENSFTDNHGQWMQAAAYAYAYYKCEANSMVEAFIYGRHVDNPGEVDPRGGGAIPWGLRDQNYNKRAIWDVYQNIDSPNGLHCTNPLLSQIGVIRSWNSISGFDKNKFAKMPSKRSKVSGLSAITTSYKSVQITWNRSSFASGYEIYRATSKNGTYKKLAPIMSNNTVSYTDGSVKMGHTYYYKVRAFHSFAMASTLYDKYAKTSVTVAVGPTNLKSATAGAESVKLKWTKVDQASGYYVYRSTSADGNYVRIPTNLSGSTVKYTDKNLLPGNTYYYKVVAFVSVSNQNLTSTESSVQSAVPVPQKATLSTLVPGQNRITVQWNPVPNASGYEVYKYDTKEAVYKKIKGINKSTSLSYKVKNLEPGTECYFKVRAYTTVGSTTVYGDYSEAMNACAYTTSDNTSFGITTWVRNADKSITISWNKVMQAYAYQVWRCNTTDGTYVQVGSDIRQADNVYSYTDKNAAPTDTWYYKIRIVEQRGKNGNEQNPDKVLLYGDWSKPFVIPALSGATTETNQPTGNKQDTESTTETQYTTETERTTETEHTTETERTTETEHTTETERTTETEHTTETERMPESEHSTETEHTTEKAPAVVTEKVNSAT